MIVIQHRAFYNGNSACNCVNFSVEGSSHRFAELRRVIEQNFPGRRIQRWETGGTFWVWVELHKVLTCLESRVNERDDQVEKAVRRRHLGKRTLHDLLVLSVL